ncbi:MAG: hypothetical protein FD138_382 [Planctomycetota bacterium]|nr:MAG: hypothetical protein FD138_382 [Planctomycetota bacterium]
MLIDRTHKPWIVASVLTLTVASSAYWVIAKHSMHGPAGGSVLGLIFGVGGSLLMIFAALLAVRKRLPTWRVGSAQFWLRGHLWLGTIGFVLILFHAGFKWGGLLENLLWISFGLVVVTGFAGVVLQQVIPRLLTTRVPLETMVAQIPFLSKTMLFRADQLIAKQAGVLNVDCEPLKPFAEEALKQQRVLKRESDFPKELAKVYANVALPDADTKKPHAPAPAEIVNTKSAPAIPVLSPTVSSVSEPAAEVSAAKPKSPLELMREKAAAKAAAGDAVATANPSAPPAAAPEKKLSPLEQMQAKLAAKKPAPAADAAEAHKPLTVENPAPAEIKKPAPIVKPTAEKPVAVAPPKPKVVAPIPPALLAELRDFHVRVVRSFLSTGRSPQHRLDDNISARRVFAQLRSDLPAELHDSIQQLEDLCEERRQFNTQLRLHRWLHWWLILHIPPSIALLVLFVAHVIVSLRVVPFGR